LAQHLDTLHGLTAEVVALSVDGRQDAMKTVEELNLRFPVCYGLDARQTGEAIGGYINTEADPAYLQPASFILRPDGRIALAVYSSGSVGRLTGEDAVAFIKTQKES
jgi:peroxiredoxin